MAAATPRRSNVVLIHFLSHPLQMRSNSHESAWIPSAALFGGRKRNDSRQNESLVFGENQWSARVSAACIFIRIMNTNRTHCGRNDNSITVEPFAFFVWYHLQWCPSEIAWYQMATFDIPSEAGYFTKCKVVRDVVDRVWQRNNPYEYWKLNFVMRNREEKNRIMPPLHSPFSVIGAGNLINATSWCLNLLS